MTDTASLAANFDDVCAAAERLAGRARRTPVLTSRTLDAMVGARVFLKAENFQRTGSFKYRGATNAVLSLDPAQRTRGVIAYSSGNHAQGLALAARQAGTTAVIVMPNNAPLAKRQATAAYGAEIVLYDPATENREKIGEGIANERGLTLVPPFNHEPIIAGQGTLAKELIEDTGPLDALLVCLGGGGLISGCALAAAALSPACKVIGVEPALGDDGARSFRSGRIESVHNSQTIADGARTTALGTKTFPIIRALVSDVHTVTEDQIIAATRFAWERMKIVVEPTGALALAGALNGSVPQGAERVGVVISGGNVDIAAMAALFRQ